MYIIKEFIIYLHTLTLSFFLFLFEMVKMKYKSTICDTT